MIILATLLLTIAVLGFIAPKDFSIEREITINKPVSVVFNYVKFVKNDRNWSPWASKDPNMTTDYRGTDGTVGFVSSWSGNDEVGVGEQETKSIVENSRIDFELRFKKPMEDTSKAYLITEAIGANQTKVKWGMIGKSEFPMNVFCMIMNMNKMLNNTFDEGLSSLKSVLEK